MMIKECDAQKIIIAVVVILVTISFVWLAWIQRQQAQLEDQWFIYFAAVHDESLDFVIENYAENTAFSYKVFVSDVAVITEDVVIENGMQKEFPINVTNSDKKTVTIEVSDSDGETKEIYKKFYE